MLNWLAHEIKAPLSTARMTAQLLERRLDQAQAPEPEKKLSAIIIRQLDRIHGPTHGRWFGDNRYWTRCNHTDRTLLTSVKESAAQLAGTSLRRCQWG